MAPGLFEDPAKTIGYCTFCGAPVPYAAGDLDADGAARHDQCWKLVRRNATKMVNAARVCLESISVLTGIPCVLAPMQEAINDLPDKVGPESVLRLLSRAIRIVESEPQIRPEDRIILCGKLNSFRRQLLADCCA